MTTFSYDDGRVWIQKEKFASYEQLLPYGMTDVTDPVGSISLVREPDPGKRRSTVVVDTLRGEPGQNSFNIETRMKGALNLMFGLRNKNVNFQAHLGECGRPDTYTASQLGLHLPKSLRGDMSIDRLAQIQGDNAAIAIQVPWTAYGLELIDFAMSFLSARTVDETENFNAVASLKDDCGENVKPGFFAYFAPDAAAAATADVFYSDDGGQTNTVITDKPFAADEHISDIGAIGTPYDHRVIVTRGVTDGSNPAEIAYADKEGGVDWTWVNVDVGSTNGQYILALMFLNFGNVFVGCEDGQIYRSDDGGASWESKKAATTDAINDISAINDGTVLAVGANDGVFLSEDYGESWDALAVTVDGAAVTGLDYNACCVTPDGTLFVGAATGELYGSADGGVAWTALSLQGITPTAVNAIQAYGDDIIYVAANIAGPAGRVLRSTDGGANFRLWNLSIPSNDGMNALDVVDANFVWGVGDTGFITRTNSTAIEK